MKGLVVKILILMISIMAVAGCSTAQDAAGRDETDNYGLSPDDSSTAGGLSGDFGEFQFGESAQWPDYIPAAIPVLPSEIETVMVAPESHIRLFYSNVSEKQIEEYLALLEDEGFKLEFRIYVQEGFPDNSEERRKRGEYDAVDITKGEYHMNLSHGAGQASYDIYTSGFQDIASTAVAITWPEDLDGILPPPDRCELVTLDSNSKDGYYITCKREDENVDQDYLNLLESMGFQIHETFQNNSGQITLLRLRRGDMVVELSPIFRMYFTMEVSLQPLPKWPDVFDSLVPKPERCEFTANIPAVQDGFHITCRPEDEKVLQDYVSTLEELGFVERDKFINKNGDIIIITLSNGATIVDLSYDSPEVMSIRVSPNSS